MGEPLHESNLPTSIISSDISGAGFAMLVQKTDYLDDESKELLLAAYRFADQAHQGQTRSSGEPYITHPISVACICASWKLDIFTLMAALLHDTIEDCGVTKEEIATRFGTITAGLVDGVTKLDKFQFNTREEGQAGSFRKMLLAMAQDIRVILVKLADRTHNMRTLGNLKPEKQRRIGRETMEIYAPLANRLGMNLLYRELQDLAFKSTMPWRFHILEKALFSARNVRHDSIKRISTTINAAFKAANLPIQLSGWQKNLYSIYAKMEERQQSFAQVTDQLSFKIIVDSFEKCYEAMGILHQLYRPLTSRFKDYIAIPKFNGYQSLHTTVMGSVNALIEFQIKTEYMDQIAEHGITARWRYEDDEKKSARLKNEKWMQSLLDIQNDSRDAGEFMENVKVDLSAESIYVFSPKSKIITLPQGSTTVDFAYSIHSDVGDHCIAARINGEQVPLSTELKSGDVVEIITAPIAKPNPAWLTFVRTGRARAKIRSHLKTLAYDASVSLGKKMLLQSLNAEGFASLPDQKAGNSQFWDKLLRITGSQNRDELLSDISLGKRLAELVVRQMLPVLQESGMKPDLVLLSKGRYIEQGKELTRRPTLLLDGTEEGSVHYAQCCWPIPGDAIIGYLGHSQGLSIHNSDCSVAAQLRHRDPERWLNVDWADEISYMFEAAIWITVRTRQAMLVSIANDLHSINADIIRIEMSTGPINAPDTFHAVLNVHNRVHLAQALRVLRRNPLVLKAGRIKPPTKTE